MMKKENHFSVNTAKKATLDSAVKLMEIKKEVKSRVSGGENFVAVVEEKGYKVVFPV